MDYKSFKKYLTEEEQSTKSITDLAREKILDLFMNNNQIDDSMVHKLSDELKIDTHIFEGEIYSILSTFIHGGMALQKNITEKDVDKNELEMGMKVELEHLNDKSPYAKMLAKRIALDHLSEDGQEMYYTKLKEMEGE